MLVRCRINIVRPQPCYRREPARSRWERGRVVPECRSRKNQESDQQTSPVGKQEETVEGLEIKQAPLVDKDSRPSSPTTALLDFRVLCSSSVTSTHDKSKAYLRAGGALAYPKLAFQAAVQLFKNSVMYASRAWNHRSGSRRRATYCLK